MIIMHNIIQCSHQVNEVEDQAIKFSDYLLILLLNLQLQKLRDLILFLPHIDENKSGPKWLPCVTAGNIPLCPLKYQTSTERKTHI